MHCVLFVHYSIVCIHTYIDVGIVLTLSLYVCVLADPMQSEVYNRYLSLMEHVQQLAELGLPNALATGGTVGPCNDSHPPHSITAGLCAHAMLHTFAALLPVVVEERGVPHEFALPYNFVYQLLIDTVGLKNQRLLHLVRWGFPTITPVLTLVVWFVFNSLPCVDTPLCIHVSVCPCVHMCVL